VLMIRVDCPLFILFTNSSTERPKEAGEKDYERVLCSRIGSVPVILHQDVGEELRLVVNDGLRELSPG
jgi:hypothetical protein